MSVNPYCLGQRCNPLNLLFKIMFLALICCSFLGGFIHALCCRVLTLALVGFSCYPQTKFSLDLHQICKFYF